jgi:hypothetical protein
LGATMTRRPGRAFIDFINAALITFCLNLWA